VAFDIKYCRKTLEDTDTHKSTRAPIYIIVFEGVYDAVAIIPCQMYEISFRLVGSNRQAVSYFDAASVLWRFMVHKSALRTFRDNILRGCYTNISTGIECPIILEQLPVSCLVPSHATVGSSISAIRWLWSQIREQAPHDIEIDFNPIQPLVGDFVIKLPKLSVALMVEHKYLSDNSTRKVVGDGTTTKFPTFVGQPFSLPRVWDILIIQTAGTSSDHIDLWCIPNYVLESNVNELGVLTLPTTHAEHLHFFGKNAISRMTSFIVANANRIACEGLTRLSLLASQPFPHDDQLVATCIDGLRGKTWSEEKPLLAPSVSGLKHHLQWLFVRLRKYCRDIGRLVLLPLDSGEVTGDFVFVEHRWTVEEQSNFDRTGNCPFEIYSPGVSSKLCIPIRFWDMTSSRTDNPHRASTTLHINRAHLLPKSPGNEFLILAATQATETQASELCVLMPSEYVRLHELLDESPSSNNNFAWTFRGYRVSYHQLSIEAREFGPAHLTANNMHPLDMSIRLTRLCLTVGKIFDNADGDGLDIAELPLREGGVTISPRRYIYTVAELARIGLRYGGEHYSLPLFIRANMFVQYFEVMLDLQ
jgi:hypothetical protein